MIKQVLCLVFFVTVLISCKKDDEEFKFVQRDRNEQYAADKIAIDLFLDTHSIKVDESFNITFEELNDGEGNLSISEQKKYPILTDTVTKDNVEYIVKYLNINEGVGINPTKYDSLLVSYKAVLLDQSIYTWKPNAEWIVPTNNLSLQNVFSIEAPKNIITKFKTGTSIDNTEDGTIEFKDYGVGVVFIPSGLGYFDASQTKLPSYTPFIMTFKLYATKFRDHDLDGILSQYEDVNKNNDYYDDDTDGDGIANFLDSDDDGDGILTKYEYQIKDGVKNWVDYDSNQNGIPNYLDQLDVISQEVK